MNARKGAPPALWSVAVLICAAPVTADAAPSAEQGAILYEAKCGGCHSPDRNRVGPAHRGVFGRKAGTAANYMYSPALKASGIVWTAANLDRWLTNPVAMVPGTRMGIRLTKAEDRADVISYLRALKAKN